MKNVNEMTIKELQTVVSRLEKYEDAHKNYVEIALKLKTIGDELISLSKIIDPLQTIVARKPRSKSVKSTIRELYSKLKGGTQITRKFVESTYTDLDSKQVSNILTNLSKCKGVEKTRDGKSIRLFSR